MSCQIAVKADDQIDKLHCYYLKNAARLIPFQCLFDLSFSGTGSKFGGGGRLMPRSCLMSSVAGQ
jgi:hypothetical protein